MKKKTFDIVFSDVHMPAMNGHELLTAINSQHPGTSVVMMDSYPEELSERCLREGALYCVHKPFDITELRDVIKIQHGSQLVSSIIDFPYQPNDEEAAPPPKRGSRAAQKPARDRKY